MKRFHVHLHVDDLGQSVGFYSKLFATEPARLEGDYAKWMLEDPRLNFAISQRGGQIGVNHLGLQTDSDQELESLNGQLQRADLATQAEKAVACCYARSNKYWITDPTGIAWETFHTLGSVPTFNGEAERAAEACCTPTAGPTPIRKAVGVPVRSAGCCS